MLTSTLFPIQQKTIGAIMDTFHGKVGHCANGKIVCLPFGRGKTLTATEAARAISESLRRTSGRSPSNHGPILVVTQRTIVETWLKNGTQHYSPPLQSLFLTRGESTVQNPDNQSWYNIKERDVLIITYETLMSIYKSVVDARTAILNEAVTEPDEAAVLKEFTKRHLKCANLNEPLPLDRLRHLEGVNNSTNVSTLLFMHKWPCFIMDECHEARTISSMVFKAVSQVRASFRICLTATPFNNSINDVISMFMLAAIHPPQFSITLSVETETEIEAEAGQREKRSHSSSSLSPSPTTTKKTKMKKTKRTCRHDFCRLLKSSAPCLVATNGLQEVESCIDISASQNTDQSVAQWRFLINNENTQELMCRLYMECRDLYIVSENIEEVREHYLPIDIVVHADFCTPSERLYYDAIANKADSDIGRILLSRMAASSLYHERDLPCPGTDLVAYSTKARRKLTVRWPSKVVIVVSLLSHAISRSEKSVVFAQYVNTVTQVQQAVVEKYGSSVKVFVVLAGASTLQRDEVIDACRNHRGAAVLVSTKILAQGRDLSFANHTFLMGVWWNDVNEKQSRARTERPDQTRSVFSTQIVMKNTVEELVWMVARCKHLINDHVMHGVVTPALVKKTTMMSALTTYAECHEFVDDMDIVTALQSVCHLYVEDIPFPCYPSTRPITPLSVRPSYAPAPRAGISRHVFPMPSAPSTARVNSFLRGGYHHRQYNPPREHSIQYQLLIGRSPSSSSKGGRPVIVIDADGKRVEK